jgi:hypothetical protein
VSFALYAVDCSRCNGPRDFGERWHTFKRTEIARASTFDDVASQVERVALKDEAVIVDESPYGSAEIFHDGDWHKLLED